MPVYRRIATALPECAIYGASTTKGAAVKVAAPTIITLAALVLVSTAPSATTARTVRVSVSSSHGQGDRPSWTAGISASGRSVAFTSEATDLVPGDTNERQDAF